MNIEDTEETKLIIVADLGLLRAYRQVQGPMDRQPHLQLLEELKPAGAHEKLSDQVTDKAGRFPRGGGAGNVPGDLSAGENLHAQAEHNRVLLRQLADAINALLAPTAVTRCAIAVSAPIHKQLLEALDPKLRAKIGQVLPSNLAKTEPGDLLAHFARAGA